MLEWDEDPGDPTYYWYTILFVSIKFNHKTALPLKGWL